MGKGFAKPEVGNSVNTARVNSGLQAGSGAYCLFIGRPWGGRGEEGEERYPERARNCQPGVRAQGGRSCQEPELTPRGDLTDAQGKQNPELPQKDPECHPKGEEQRQFPGPPQDQRGGADR